MSICFELNELLALFNEPLNITNFKNIINRGYANKYSVSGDIITLIDFLKRNPDAELQALGEQLDEKITDLKLPPGEGFVSLRMEAKTITVAQVNQGGRRKNTRRKRHAKR